MLAQLAIGEWTKGMPRKWNMVFGIDPSLSGVLLQRLPGLAATGIITVLERLPEPPWVARQGGLCPQGKEKKVGSALVSLRMVDGFSLGIQTAIVHGLACLKMLSIGCTESRRRTWGVAEGLRDLTCFCPQPNDNPRSTEVLMSFQLGNRDANGLLCGTIEPGGGQWPIDILSRITPFLYPCSSCQSVVLHVVVAEQHSGLGFKIPFMKRPLASIGKTYAAICNRCANVNTTLTSDALDGLSNGLIPSQICQMYTAVCDQPEPYTAEYTQRFLAKASGDNQQINSIVRTWLGAYRRADGKS